MRTATGVIRAFLLVLLCIGGAAGQKLPPDAERQLAREIYKELIEINSSFSTGATTPVAETMAARLKAA
jgi:hypothetical protein